MFTTITILAAVVLVADVTLVADHQAFAFSHHGGAYGPCDNDIALLQNVSGSRIRQIWRQVQDDKDSTGTCKAWKTV